MDSLKASGYSEKTVKQGDGSSGVVHSTRCYLCAGMFTKQPGFVSPETSLDWSRAAQWVAVKGDPPDATLAAMRSLSFQYGESSSNRFEGMDIAYWSPWSSAR
jgi:hypothetical protein